jgi:hypothetical protein
MNVDKDCVTHHHACDCREAAMKKLAENMLFKLWESNRMKIIVTKTIYEDYLQRAQELFGELK